MTYRQPPFTALTSEQITLLKTIVAFPVKDKEPPDVEEETLPKDWREIFWTVKDVDKVELWPSNKISGAPEDVDTTATPLPLISTFIPSYNDRDPREGSKSTLDNPSKNSRIQLSVG